MPDFTIIDGGGPRDRDRVPSEEEFVDVLRMMAATTLRTIRGAGKPHELLPLCSELVQAASRFKDAAGHWPPASMIAKALKMSDAVEDLYDRDRAGEIPERNIDRRHQDGTIDRHEAESAIKKGVLQIIASQLLDQPLQEKAGETEMRKGITDAVAARDKRQKYLGSLSRI